MIFSIKTFMDIERIKADRPVRYSFKRAQLVLVLMDQGFTIVQLRQLTVNDIDFDKSLIIYRGCPYPLGSAADLMRAWLKIRRARPGVTVLFTSYIGLPPKYRAFNRDLDRYGKANK